MESGTLAVTALTGGLAGSLITLGGQSLRNWWTRPILEIAFDQDEPGCLVNTNVVGGTQIVQSHLRLKISNRGILAAKDVSLCVTRLSFEAPGSGVRTFEEEVMDLKLALTENQTVFRLAGRGAHRFIDLSHTQLVTSGVLFSIDFVIAPARLNILGLGAGTYRAEVVASADNAASVRRTVSWSFSGAFPGLHIIGVE